MNINGLEATNVRFDLVSTAFFLFNLPFVNQFLT